MRAIQARAYRNARLQLEWCVLPLLFRGIKYSETKILRWYSLPVPLGVTPEPPARAEEYFLYQHSAALPPDNLEPAVPGRCSHGKSTSRTSRLGPSPTDYEVLTSAELAQRLKVKESWVIDQSKRSRTHDPIPVFRLGKHRRYRRGSPELNAWLDRRAGYTQQQRKAGSSRNGGTIE